MKLQLVQREDTYHISEVHTVQVTSLWLKERRYNPSNLEIAAWSLPKSTDICQEPLR